MSLTLNALITTNKSLLPSSVIAHFKSAYHFMESYKTDLSYDIEDLISRKGAKFLHIVDLTSTALYPATLKDLPAPGVIVPYLFASVDDRQMVQSFIGGVSSFTSRAKFFLLNKQTGTVETLTKSQAVETMKNLESNVQARSRAYFTMGIPTQVGA